VTVSPEGLSGAQAEGAFTVPLRQVMSREPRLASDSPYRRTPLFFGGVLQGESEELIARVTKNRKTVHRAYIVVNISLEN